MKRRVLSASDLSRITPVCHLGGNHGATSIGGDHGKPSHTIAPSTLEQRKAGRPEGAPQAQRHPGDPGPAAATRQGPRLGSVQPDDRFQAHACDLVKLRVSDVPIAASWPLGRW